MSLMIYLVRHGQTEYNLNGRIQGWCDSPLTAEGRHQAEETGRRLQGVPFAAAFASTSPRAADTARMILSHAGQAAVTLSLLDELREYCFGSFEGGQIDTLYRRLAQEQGYASPEEWVQAYRHADYQMLAEAVAESDPEQLAENEARFLSRLHQGLFKVLAASPAHGNILVVSHGMAITALLKEIRRDALLYRSVPNGSVTRLAYNVFGGLQIEDIAVCSATHFDPHDIVGPDPTKTAKALARRRSF